MIWIIRLAIRSFSRGRRAVERVPKVPIEAIDPARGATGSSLTWVLRVIDGDTVDVRQRGERIRVRLSAIDCPEDGQPWGNTAKAGLIKMIGGKSVHLEEYGYDDYGRMLATVFVRDHETAKWINVNERMVTLGHAWVMRAYYTHLPLERRNQLNRLETWAKSRRVGLWKTLNPIPPWEWRHKG